VDFRRRDQLGLDGAGVNQRASKEINYVVKTIQ
jgi:hypothetical protein